jgi:hypothetical protein
MRSNIFVRLFAVGFAAALTGCPTPTCKDKTVLVTATFDSASRAADSLQIVVELDGNAQPGATVPGPHGHDSGTVQVEFPSGYHAGSTLTVTIAAQLGGQTVAQGSASTTLVAGCTVLPISVGGGGTGEDLSSAPDMLQLPNPVAAAKPDFVGFITSLDATGSTDPLGDTLAFKWAIEQAPTGSAITTSSLTSTTTAKTNFEPDLGGVYKIALTVTAATDGRSATTVANVTVPTVPVFYSRLAQDATTMNLSPHLVGSDGTGDHLVGCPFSADGGAGSTVQIMPFFGHAYDPPTGGTPEFVFLGIVDFSGMTPPQLQVATPSTDCGASKPVRVDANMFNDHIAVAARFSPDGKRIVYVDAPQGNSGTYRLVTVASDGVGPKRVIRSDGFFGFTPAIWLDNSTVAWLEDDTQNVNPFTIWKAPDENAAGDAASGKRTQVLRCDQSVTSTHLAQINQFEMSAFGMIVAGTTSTRCALCTPPLAAVQLFKLAANDCSTTTAKQLIAEPQGGLSWDFALSPDGLTILFSSTHGGAIPDGGYPIPQSDIFEVPADGSSAAQRIAGDSAYDDVEPRFIAGGRQFMWTRAPRMLDMGADTPAILFANADGTHVRTFTPGAATGETVLRSDIGANRGFDCSWIPGSAGSSAATPACVLAALLLLALVRRRGATWRSRGRS